MRSPFNVGEKYYVGRAFAAGDGRDLQALGKSMEDAFKENSGNRI